MNRYIQRAISEMPSRIDDPCVVYVLKPESVNRVKIGFSRFNVLQSRIGNIQIGCPYPIRCLLVLLGGAKLETLIHTGLSAHRRIGEWFELGPEVEGFIAQAQQEIRNLATGAKWNVTRARYRECAGWIDRPCFLEDDGLYKFRTPSVKSARGVRKLKEVGIL